MPATIAKAVAPDYPYEVRYLNIPPVVVRADVTVGTDGKPVAVTITKSSGYASIDAATLLAARQSTYTAKLKDCQPVTGNYVFRAEFWPDNPLQSLSPPAFRPPAGWSANSNPSAAPNFREFGEWAYGKNTIGIMGAFVHGTLEQFVEHKSAQITASSGKILSSEALALCSGARQGWELEYSQAGTNYAEVMVSDDMRLFEAYYYGADAPSDPTISSSLVSICPMQ